ncbi:MAG TPA: DUF1080 domain-containing protein [Phycisphaerae bacterium]|nr:DUF1080 domain-containing protein [Phycisphaerae bacterium]HRY66504.1 DUF1080 domain-containing protein [Phycisphaerae bacterium]HSA28616.1 DUF1080 domain-containing protein [Phycisphaerae bacterium]
MNQACSNHGCSRRFVATLLVAGLAGCASTPRDKMTPSGPIPAPRPGETIPLFDGQSLAGWRVLKDGAFEHHGQVGVKDGTIVLERGSLQTGVGWNGQVPRDDYEVSLEAMRTDGNDFFCGLTFPVGDEPCTWIIGGWGGSVVGLSNVDNDAAVENVTTQGMTFESNRWYKIRLRVTTARIDAWIDDRQMIDLERGEHKFSVWWEQEPARPLGIATWDTGAALRHISLKRL